ncbi:PH and Oxysterol BP domain containing protein [Trichuris trichiura]|uniref:Oxysterol-binding protein n=1 Tax=Trichuris trichiura TaxID=36087 RepID=A0A077ZK00_TRITR|nr:PH and Oxysterol BP domain containing protein [Trichuris trichiura]
MEGPLSKWTNVIEGWQFRWFLLDENAGTLSYYTSKEKMVKGQRRGCVRLKGAVVGLDDEDDSTFTITVDQKMFHFQAYDCEERDRWIRALESTIQLHSDLYRYRFSKRFGKDSARTSSKLAAFETKISEVDSYLQMIIEKVKTLETFGESLKSSADKEKVDHILEITGILLDSFKHSIVLLQYAKNQIIPSTEGLGTLHVRTTTEGAYVQNKGVDSTAPTAKLEPIEIATEVLSPNDDKVKHEVTPEVSYSSSEDGDELFYDTVEQRAIIGNELCIGQDAADELSSQMTPLQMLNENSVEAIDQFPYVVDNEPDFSQPNYDFDSAYDDEAEDEIEDTREHGNLIVHLLSQLTVGMDLTKFTLPTYILERRSLLEMYADFMTFPDLFGKIADAPTPEARMIAVLRWYMSMFYGGRRSGLAKKPYNPILGETFTCKYKVLDGDSSQLIVNGSQPSAGVLPEEITFVGEQVSHHPPVSAFYVEYPSKQLQVNGQIWTKSKFLGLSMAVHNVGQTCLSVLKHNEEYIFDFPSGYGRSILTTPWVEFGGKCSIRCDKTGYSVDLEFQTKPFYNGKVHCVKADLYRPFEKTSFATVRGHWNACMTIKTSNSEEVFLDVRRLDPAKKICQPVLEQKSNESRRLWRHVTVALKEKDVHKATKCKFWLEQRQRDAAKIRALKNIKWQPVLFQECGENWIYRSPLSRRLSNNNNL